MTSRDIILHHHYIRLTFPMFGICATVKRTRSLDTPSDVTNQIQPFDDDLLFEEECCHDNTAENHPFILSNDSNTDCHSNTIATTWRTHGIKRSVQLFNSPYMVDNNKENPTVMMYCSNNKKRKTVYTPDDITTSKVTKRGDKVSDYNHVIM